MEKKEIPIEPFYLIPQWQSEKLESSSANFSLSFSKMNLWKESKKNKCFEIFNKLDSWTKEENIKGETIKTKYVEVADSKTIFNNEHLCKLSNCQLKDKQNFLDKIKYNQKEYIDFMNGFEIKAKLVSPFITGLGSGHPTETGMILDRNTGVPYIPASSIKGVLRTAYAVANAREIKEKHKNSKGVIEEYDCIGVPDDELDVIFGGENNSSKVIFLDAYPERIPTIQSDIMNPHFTKYYGGENIIPLENENPVPIKFLSVKEGCDFVFRYIVKDENLKSEIENAFKIAFETIGFGGKTAIGYGRFDCELFKKEESAPVQEKKDYSEADIDELVKKIKKAVKSKQGEKTEGYIFNNEKGEFIVKIKLLGKNEPISVNLKKTNSELKVGDKVEVILKDVPKGKNPNLAEILRIF